MLLMDGHTGIADIIYAPTRVSSRDRSTSLPLREMGPHQVFRAEEKQHGCTEDGQQQAHECRQDEHWPWPAQPYLGRYAPAALGRADPPRRHPGHGEPDQRER